MSQLSKAEVRRRLLPGTTVRLIWNYKRGDTDTLLTVQKMQTNGCRFVDQEGKSWWQWWKGMKFEATPSGYLFLSTDGQHISTYDWTDD